MQDLRPHTSADAAREMFRVCCVRERRGNGHEVEYLGATARLHFLSNYGNVSCPDRPTTAHTLQCTLVPVAPSVVGAVSTTRSEHIPYTAPTRSLPTACACQLTTKPSLLRSSNTLLSRFNCLCLPVSSVSSVSYQKTDNFSYVACLPAADGYILL